MGDWVAISEYVDNKVLIHDVFPRKTKIERQAVEKGELDKASYENYLKMEREKMHFESSNCNSVIEYLIDCN